ncbi:MAG: hypothetical protein IJ678_01155 [Kiritimatiellae bacterium]|nr:hypothetical protein [Kiritimatiellia bacterium]
MPGAQRVLRWLVDIGSSISIAAAAKRAMNDGEEFVRVEIFGRPSAASSAKVIREEDVPLDELDEILEKAKTEPVLAMRA